MDKFLDLKSVIKKKGIRLDVYMYNTIANMHIEAKSLLQGMVDKCISPNTMSYTTLIDIHCPPRDNAVILSNGEHKESAETCRSACARVVDEHGAVRDTVRSHSLSPTLFLSLNTSVCRG